MKGWIIALIFLAAVTPVFAQTNVSISIQNLNVNPQKVFVGDYAIVSLTLYNLTDKIAEITSLGVYGEGIIPESLDLGYIPPKSTHTLSFSVKAIEKGVHNIELILYTKEGPIKSFFVLFVEDKMPEIYSKGIVRVGEINNLNLVISSPVEIENVVIVPLFESLPEKIVLKSVSGIAEVNPNTEPARGLAINFSAPFTAVSLYDVVEIDLEIASGEKKNIKLLYSPEKAGEDKIKLVIWYRNCLGGEGRIEREIAGIKVNNETAVDILGIDISTRRIATTTAMGGFPAGRTTTTASVIEITVSGEVANRDFGQARNVIVYLDFGKKTEEFFIGTISPSDSDSFSIPATGNERNVRVAVEWTNELGEIHISKTYQLSQRSFEFSQKESPAFTSLNMAIIAICVAAFIAGIIFYRKRRGRR